MSNQIITYPQAIRDLCGIDTVIFTYSRDVALKLRRLMSDDFQIIHHDLNVLSVEEIEWIQDGLYHSHIFIVTESESPFLNGYALAYATAQNPELVIGLGLDEQTKSFLSFVVKDEVNSFNNILEVADFIEEQ